MQELLPSEANVDLKSLLTGVSTIISNNAGHCGL